MITSIFSKSKPVNFVLVFVIILSTFVVATIKFSDFEENTNTLLNRLTNFVLCYFSILLLNFVVTKNRLTKSSNYEILLLSLFMLLIPQSILSREALLSNLFVLLSLRRTISLRSQKNTIRKLFDSGLWIGVASLFYFWSILFFSTIIAGLIFYGERKFNKWLVPFLGILTSYVTMTSAQLIFYDNYYWIQDLSPTVSFIYDSYNNLPLIVAITVLLSFGVWASFFYLKNLKSKMKTLKPGFKIILTTYLTALAIIIIAPNKTGGEFIFLFSPLAVILTNYIETVKEKWFKELFLATIIIIPILTLIL